MILKSLYLWVFLFSSAPLYAAEPQIGVLRRAADTGFTILDIGISNAALWSVNRFGQALYGLAAFSEISAESIRDNLPLSAWKWETRDRFHVNQMGHPYQGSTYFAAARANGFNFYQSIPFALLGSYTWEVFFEKATPSINDSISTPAGGLAFGEMFHRIFLEMDVSHSVWAKIGSTLISPADRVNSIFRPGKKGGGNIYDFRILAGPSYAFTRFTGHEEDETSWRYPSVYIETMVTYGDPFDQHSLIPYDQFELDAAFSGNILNLNAKITSDGYIFSFTPLQTRYSSASMGLSFNFDYFNATNDIFDNYGYGNINFVSHALDWTVKYRRGFSEYMCMELRAHIGWTPWGVTHYNGTSVEDLYANYGMGKNLKLFFSLAHQRRGTLDASALFYDLFSLPVSVSGAKGAVFFVHATLAYDYPLSGMISLGVKHSFSALLGFYDHAPDINNRIGVTTFYATYQIEPRQR